MYLHNFYLILATVIATLHSCNARSSDPIKRFETAVGQYDRKILEMSNANVVKKTHLLDTGKLTTYFYNINLISAMTESQTS